MINIFGCGNVNNFLFVANNSNNKEATVMQQQIAAIKQVSKNYLPAPTCNMKEYKDDKIKQCANQVSWNSTLDDCLEYLSKLPLDSSAKDQKIIPWPQAEYELLKEQTDKINSRRWAISGLFVAGGPSCASGFAGLMCPNPIIVALLAGGLSAVANMGAFCLGSKPVEVIADAKDIKQDLREQFKHLSEELAMRLLSRFLELAPLDQLYSEFDYPMNSSVMNDSPIDLELSIEQDLKLREVKKLALKLGERYEIILDSLSPTHYTRNDAKNILSLLLETIEFIKNPKQYQFTEVLAKNELMTVWSKRKIEKQDKTIASQSKEISNKGETIRSLQEKVDEQQQVIMQLYKEFETTRNDLSVLKRNFEALKFQP
ncbi:MAG: hypothetical protein K0S74_1278 [Chlamydiales bacterium]|jgi:hypothetical protein|nr:hypothetical protein [Chlamydiales bacterium]